MIVQHYRELLWYYRGLVVSVVVVTTLMGAVLSALRLSVSPAYTAAASVVVIPTEAEFAFGRETGQGGPRSTARGLTATYMEYLKSRPVVESAIAKIAEMSGGQKPPAPVASAPVRFVRACVSWARRTYRTIDSGKYVPKSPEAREVDRLTGAINLEKVADSYILRIEVSLEDPAAAAAAANALAEAYVERVSEQLATSADQIGSFLEQQIELRQASLEALLTKEEKLKSELGISSLEEERQHFLAARELARQKLIDAQVELEAVDAELQLLGEVDIAQSGRSLAELAEERALASARRRGLLKNIELRQKAIGDVSRSLRALRDKEEPLVALRQQIETMQQELVELQTRMLSTNLTQTSPMAQVRVIDPAVMPTYPSSPRVVKNTAISFFAGLLVSLLSVFVIDTLSGTVKTTPDLERLTGPRCLGLLRKRLVSYVNDPVRTNSGWANKSLRSFGEELERGLTLVGAFEANVLQVTGFLEPSRLRGAAVAVAAALASQGTKVVCKLPAGDVFPGVPRGVPGECLNFADALSELPNPDGLPVECLPPVSAELNLGEAARHSAALLCLIPAGEVRERTVDDLREAALRSGMSAASFVLLA